MAVHGRGTFTARAMTTEDEAHLIVIGSGGAAMAAGIEAPSRGRTVLLVEHGRLGGTCLNIGCVPSKNLLAAAGQRHRALTSRFPMAPTSADAVDLPALTAQKQELIDGMRQRSTQTSPRRTASRSIRPRPVRRRTDARGRRRAAARRGRRGRDRRRTIRSDPARAGPGRVPDLHHGDGAGGPARVDGCRRWRVTAGSSRPSCGLTSEPASPRSAGSLRTADPKSPRCCAARSPTTASASSGTAPLPWRRPPTGSWSAPTAA